MNIGEKVRLQRQKYYLIEEKVQELASITGERVQYMIEEHGYGVYVYWEAGENAVTTDSRNGKRLPLHSIAAGKMILANMPEEHVHDILDRRPLSAQTAHMITNKKTFFDELKRIHDCNYTFNRQENTDGLNLVGVPIRDSDDQTIGAISISRPTYRLKGKRLEQELPDLLLGTVNEIELNLT